ncbi:MAG: class I SAM-dependent methyltransferase [Cyanobacteria bacterium P01_H01_bin.58]
MVAARQQKPAWAGEEILSRWVNRLIQIKPLYGLMKWQARRVMIRTAETQGIPWREICTQLETSAIQAQLADLTNPTVTYPDYYQVPFHAYDAGNLCWQAAFEATPATYAIALRIWPKEKLTWQAAQDRLRGQFYQALSDYLNGTPQNTPKGIRSVQDILDVGCSVGVSTRWLHHFFQQQQTVHTTGLDLSPYMLAVAQHLDTKRAVSQWIHAPAEQTGLPDASFDLVTLQFVTHELPRSATIAIVQEIRRLLRPGGTLAIADNNPQSAVLQNLPPVLFTLMKSTEPWSDDYYTFDIEAALRELGFQHVFSQATDPRHRGIFAQKEC